jgi:hypothetical protein
MYMSCMLLEECVRTVQLESELQAAKFDMMAPVHYCESRRIDFKGTTVTSLDKICSFCT